MGERLLRPERWSQPYIVGLRHICLPGSEGKNNAKGETEENSVKVSPSRRRRKVVRILNDVEMAKQFARMNFFALRHTFGANACRSGFVWRNLDVYDYVCVTERRKQNAQREDKYSTSRTTAEKQNATHCVEPFLPRKAFPGDKICVSAAEKFRVFRENLQAYSTLKHVSFFNGLDTVGP
ncbi:hypothetical protein niasHT_007082 [Heterodera trifolii]|uniref:Uncharacterized protein n=1 Tax=Heterodera trifolii TaxID=157864 RepID=A0ABD2LXM0_9BILA